MINVDNWVKIVDNQTNKVIAAGKVTKRKDNYVDNGVKYSFNAISFEDKWFFNENYKEHFHIEPNEEHLEIPYDENNIPDYYKVLTAKDFKYDNKADIYREYGMDELDEEVKDLVYVLNEIEGIKTISSCCGHNREPLWIDIIFFNINSLSLLINIIWKKFNYDFVLSTDRGIVNNYTSHCSLKLYTTAKGEEAYAMAKKLANCLKMVTGNN